MFKNKDGQVRWGYKFLSVIVIWEILVPIAMLDVYKRQQWRIMRRSWRPLIRL